MKLPSIQKFAAWISVAAALALQMVAAHADLEKLVESLVTRTLEPCKKALADAGLNADKIDEVVLVGGVRVACCGAVHLKKLAGTSLGKTPLDRLSSPFTLLLERVSAIFHSLRVRYLGACPVSLFGASRRSSDVGFASGRSGMLLA